MWRVRFELGSMSPSGEIVNRVEISEGGFDNKGQANAWLFDGAKLRYGPAFWGKLQEIHVEEDQGTGMRRVPEPPFTAGGATRYDDGTVVEATCWYNREEMKADA